MSWPPRQGTGGQLGHPDLFSKGGEGGTLTPHRSLKLIILSYQLQVPPPNLPRALALA